MWRKIDEDSVINFAEFGREKKTNNTTLSSLVAEIQSFLVIWASKQVGGATKVCASHKTDRTKNDCIKPRYLLVEVNTEQCDTIFGPFCEKCFLGENVKTKSENVTNILLTIFFLINWRFPYILFYFCLREAVPCNLKFSFIYFGWFFSLFA